MADLNSYIFVGPGVWGKSDTLEKAKKEAAKQNGTTIKKMEKRPHIIYKVNEKVWVSDIGSLRIDKEDIETLNLEPPYWEVIHRYTA